MIDNAEAVDAVQVEKGTGVPGENDNVVIEVVRDGRVIATRRTHNLVVNVGKAQMASRLVAIPTKLFQYMRLGKNATPSVSSQTTITAIVAGSNRTCESPNGTAAMSGQRTAKFIRTWLTTDFSATGIVEAGIFDQLTAGSGVMLARVTFTAVNKSAHDSLKITWTVKVN